MKRITIIGLIILLSACDKYLDIEPQQSIAASQALNDENGIRTAILGMYQLFTENDTYQVGHPILNSDLLINTADLLWTGFNLPDINPILDKQISTTNNLALGFWITSYAVISQANAIESALGQIEFADKNKADKNRFLGEISFIRGLVYSYLIELYAEPWAKGRLDSAPGVPIVLHAEDPLENGTLPRSTIKEVYDFIIDEFQMAKDLLPEQNGFFPTTFSASAMLSRIFLIQEKYHLVEQESSRVLAAGQFELLADYNQVFNQASNTSEDLFAFQITPTDGANVMSELYTGELEGGEAFIAISDDHILKYEPGDLRSELFYFDQKTGSRRTGKWRTRPSYDGNITIIRLAEMVLNRAEARYHLGDLSGSLQDINTIRERAGLPQLSTDDLDLKVILKERYCELVFEGHQFRDLKRTRSQVGTLPYDDPSLVFPIPQREIDVNPALVQNEGY